MFHVSMSCSSREVVNSALYSVHPKSPKLLWTALQSCSLCQLIARCIAHVVLFTRSSLFSLQLIACAAPPCVVTVGRRDAGIKAGMS